MITRAAREGGGKISGGWVNFTLTIDPVKWVRIQLTLTAIQGRTVRCLR
jgi:hypothetical protein